MTYVRLATTEAGVVDGVCLWRRSLFPLTENNISRILSDPLHFIENCNFNLTYVNSDIFCNLTSNYKSNLRQGCIDNTIIIQLKARNASRGFWG
jgi:hypothetical protein